MTPAALPAQARYIMIWRLASWLLFAVVTGVAATAIGDDRCDRFDDPLPNGAIMRLGTLRLRHPDLIHDLDFSPDGRTLASAGDEGVVRIWDVATGKQILKLQGHQGGAHAAAFSPDGRHIAFFSAMDVWIMRSDGTGRRNVTHMPALEETHPTWMPDGRLSFLRYGDAGPIELWVVDADGTEAHRLDTSVEPVFVFAWKPR